MTVPAPVFRTYSSVCTNVVWQKHKAFKDQVKSKTTRKTGLGDKLKAAEKAWAKIPWAKLDGKKLAAKDLKTARQNLTNGTEAMDLVTAAKAAVTTARDQAQLTMKIDGLSAGAKRQAEVIRNGLNRMINTLNKVNTDDLQKAVDDLA